VQLRRRESGTVFYLCFDCIVTVLYCTLLPFLLQNIVQEGRKLKDHPAPIHGH